MRTKRASGGAGPGGPRAHAGAVVAATALVVLALAGCTDSPAPSPSPLPTFTATATPRPSTTTTPSATAAASTPTAAQPPTAAPGAPSTPVDLADPASWVIDFHGIGPITLGRSVDATTSDLAGFAVYPDTGQGCPSVIRPYPGGLGAIGFTPDPADATAVGDAFFNGPGDPALHGITPETAAGIGPGSAEADVRAAYPDAVVGGPKKDITPYSITDNGGRFIHVQVFQGFVLAVEVNSAPEPSNYLCS